VQELLGHYISVVAVRLAPPVRARSAADHKASNWGFNHQFGTGRRSWSATTRHMPGAAQNEFWGAVKGIKPVFERPVIPHSCYGLNCPVRPRDRAEGIRVEEDSRSANDGRQAIKRWVHAVWPMLLVGCASDQMHPYPTSPSAVGPPVRYPLDYPISYDRPWRRNSFRSLADSHLERWHP